MAVQLTVVGWAGIEGMEAWRQLGKGAAERE